ncbi:MAG TPA: phosphate ABC transporter permease subunit PstC [Acidimicrobiales bacterium]|nr:phosphate ABC transporter permease subunit PstC [Acidimicrobiales bacterium]
MPDDVDPPAPGAPRTPLTVRASTLEEIPPAERTPVAGVQEALRKRGSRRGGRLYAGLRWGGATVFAAVAVALVVSLLTSSSQAFSHSGLSLLWTGTWDPPHRIFGAETLIVGTLVTTAVALVLAVPIGVATAAFLAELAPRWLAAPLSVLIDLIAAVPSIVVGLWGLLVLTPVFAGHVEPFFQKVPVLEWFFHGPAVGPSILLAGVVLAVMILPTIVALSRTALAGVALTDREAARALGGTRWQVVRRAVIPGARTGIEAAVTLAMGRALGESIAVAMVIGNLFVIPHSLLHPGATLGSAIINTFGGVTTGLERSEVIALVVILLVLTALVNAGGQLLLRSRAQSGHGT